MTKPTGNPRGRPPKVKEFDATQHQIGQAKPRFMPTTGNADLTESEIEVVDGPAWKDKAEELAFMEELVEVVVHPTSDRNANPIPDVYVNGIPQRFIRGRKQLVKRKFVEGLARAKPISYSQDLHVEPATGNVAQVMLPQVGLEYPFSVTKDTQRGRDWLQKILAEA